MKRLFDRVLVLVAAAGLGAVAGACAAAGAAQWSYVGANGPAKWSKLDKEFALCAQGTAQSPIDIRNADVRKGDMPPLLFNYKPSPLRIVDDGHAIQVNYAPDSWVTVAGTRYELVEIRFHKPAEEKIDGKGHDMSAHLVHRAKDGKLAIIAVLLDAGAANPVVASMWSNLPVAKGKESVVDSVQVNALGLLPKTKNYYTFPGSLTAPPCTENVTWYVMQTPVSVSAEQIAQFGRLYPMNARPVQPGNGRDITGSR